MQDIDPQRRGASDRNARPETAPEEFRRTSHGRYRSHRYVDRDTQRGGKSNEPPAGRSYPRDEDEHDSYDQGHYRRSTAPYRYPGGSGRLRLDAWQSIARRERSAAEGTSNEAQKQKHEDRLGGRSRRRN
jgi:hypothetical protein